MERNSDSDRALEAEIRRTAERALGAAVSGIAPISGQLGLRRFFRVALAAGPVATLVARVDRPEDPLGRPADAPPEPPLEPIRALLERCSLPVPAHYGGDEAAGIDLLEDLGERTLGDAAAASPAERSARYREACDLVPRLQRIADPGTGVAAFARHLDAPLFAYKADLFATWALGEGAGGAGSQAARGSVRAAFDAAARAAARAPQRLAHRDLQSSNLHLVPGRGLVMIDLQGAFLAPPEYDLVCLLRDSYVELADDEVAGLLARVRPQLPDAPEAEEFAQRFDLLTITRKGKDLARFLYAAAERGDARYLPCVPRTLRMLRAAAARAAARDPELRDFADLCHALREPSCAR